MKTRISGKARGDSKHEAHGADNPAPEAGMSRDVINIGLNAFSAAVAVYDEETKKSLEWLWGYIFDVLDGSKSKLLSVTGLEYKHIYNAFIGQANAIETATLCEVIEKLQREYAVNSGFVETVVTRRITEALDYARDRSAMVAIKGPTGRSKTFTAQHWARNNNHGRSRYIRIPSGCTRRTIVQLLCRSCGIGVNGKKTADLEWRLFRAFNKNNIIIADEAGHLLPRCGTGTSAIELLRDLHDMCGCGIALIFTDVYLDEMRGGRLAAYFEQFIGRIKFEVTIPPEVRKDEVLNVVKAFNPNPSNKMLAYSLALARSRDGKLRALFEDLKRAREWGAERGGEHPEYNELKITSEWRKEGGVWPVDMV